MILTAFLSSLTSIPVRAIGLKKIRRNNTRGLSITALINKDQSTPIILNREVDQRYLETEIPYLNYKNIYDQEKRRL